MKASPHQISINGAHGEGGGALFRSALVMSALTQQSVRIHRIRGATRKPGVTSEDLAFLKALEQISNAKVQGNDLDSSELIFEPTCEPRAIQAELSVRDFEKGVVPGNALMILQSLLPVLARSGGLSFVGVQGETYNPNTLTFDAFTDGTLQLHRRQGIYAYASQQFAGFGYGGLGEVHCEIEPSELLGFEWSSRGKLLSIVTKIAYAEIHHDVLDRGIAAAKTVLEAAGHESEVELREVNSRSPGVYVTMTALYEKGIGVGGAMGTRGLRMERVVETAWEQLNAFMRSAATLDPYLADQALIAAAFAGQPTSFSTPIITPRLQTMAWVVKQFLPISLTLLGKPGELAKVKVAPN